MTGTVISVIVMCGGSALIGFIIGHRKGFSDGFDSAVENSEEIGKIISEEMFKNARMKVLKVVDGELKEVDGVVEEKPETVE